MTCPFKSCGHDDVKTYLRVSEQHIDKKFFRYHLYVIGQNSFDLLFGDYPV